MSMSRRGVGVLWAEALALVLLPIVLIGVLGNWVVSGATNQTTVRSTGLSGGNVLLGISCIVGAVGLAGIAARRLRNPRDVSLDAAFRRGLLFGGLAGGIACGIRVLLASNWTVSSDGRSYGVFTHAGWGAWLTTLCFAGYAAAGIATTRFARHTVAAVPAREVSSLLDTVALLRVAIINGDEASGQALLAAGPEGVELLRDLLKGELRLDLPAGGDRGLIDHVTAVSCALAARFPEKYAATFADASWMKHSEVLLGLGYTQRAEAVPVLITALLSDLPGTTRLSAAISLRYFRNDAATQALTNALNDPDNLVRHHAQQSLAALGVSPSA